MDYWGSIGIATLVFAVLGVIFTFVPFMKDRGFVVVVVHCPVCVHFFSSRLLCVFLCFTDSAASLCGRRSCACGSCGSARTPRRSTLLATRSSRRQPTTSPRNKIWRAFFFPFIIISLSFFNILMLFFSLPPSLVHSLYYYYSITTAPCVLSFLANPSFTPLSLSRQTNKKTKNGKREAEGKGKKHIHKWGCHRTLLRQRTSR